MRLDYFLMHYRHSHHHQSHSIVWNHKGIRLVHYPHNHPNLSLPIHRSYLGMRLDYFLIHYRHNRLHRCHSIELNHKGTYRRFGHHSHHHQSLLIPSHQNHLHLRDCSIHLHHHHSNQRRLPNCLLLCLYRNQGTGRYCCRHSHLRHYLTIEWKRRGNHRLHCSNHHRLNLYIQHYLLRLIHK